MMNVVLTNLEAEKVRACIHYQINRLEMKRSKLEQQLDSNVSDDINDITSLIDFYTTLANKF